MSQSMNQNYNPASFADKLGRRLFGVVADFHTPRTVVISDVRVGLIDKVCLGFIGFYVVRQIWYTQTWVLTSQSTGGPTTNWISNSATADWPQRFAFTAQVREGLVDFLSAGTWWKRTRVKNLARRSRSLLLSALPSGRQDGSRRYDSGQLRRVV